MAMVAMMIVVLMVAKIMGMIMASALVSDADSIAHTDDLRVLCTSTQGGRVPL